MQHAFMKTDSESAEGDHTVFHREILIGDNTFRVAVSFTNNRFLE